MCIIYFCAVPDSWKLLVERSKEQLPLNVVLPKSWKKTKVFNFKKCPNTLSVALFSALIFHRLVKGNTTVKLKAALALPDD